MRRYTLKVDRPRTRQPGYLDELNPEQRRVAEAIEGPVLVVAGAGTGKTRTLVYRTAHLLDRGIRPECILLLTFTNKASREMIERVTRLVPSAAERVWAGTFHGIGNRILRRHADRLGYGTNFGIINGQEAKDLMTSVIGEVLPKIEGRRFPKADVLVRILSSTINTDRALKEVVESDYPQFAGQVARIDEVLTTYLTHKVEMNLMDYDDLLINWRMLFEDHPDLLEQYRLQFEHVLVDEYQDTNRLQASIVATIASHHRNVMVVGDDCQSIYGFRGADIGNILEFPRLFEGCRVFRLETNYRSTPEVLNVANRSIAHNRARFDKTLTATRSSGEKPAFVALADPDQQAQFVAQRVLELRDEGVELRQQAVLYRAHYQAMGLQIELQRRGIPFVVRSGMRFFEQAHIRDLLAHLRILYNPLDRLAWTRVLKLQEGIGNAHAFGIYRSLVAHGDPWRALQSDLVGGELPARARKAFERTRTLLLRLCEPSMTGNPSALIDAVLEGGYRDFLRQHHPNADQRIEDIHQLGNFAAQFGDYTGFLQELALVENVSAEEIATGGESDEYLLLSTVHQAKGLEWDAVFILSLADGRFPLGRALRSQDDEEEERRLFYVAVTRARKYLYFCYPQWGRDRERQRVLLRPSRFLGEIGITGGELVETWQISEVAASVQER